VSEDSEAPSEPALPAEVPPPLPNEAPPGQDQDDGWDPVWDETAQAFYFYNRFTKLSQWENPRIPPVTEPAPPGVGNYDRIENETPNELPATAAERPAGGYDPAIHGDYDPNADYAKTVPEDPNNSDPSALHPPGTTAIPPGAAAAYATTGTFNRFTGKWQAATLNPENFNDENKSKRQMNAYFDVDAAANSHDGKSLKAERSGKKLSKKELKAFKDKRRERKEEKRRAWLRD
jgi:WW domain